MSSIKSGNHTIKEILEVAGFDFHAKASADYNNGDPDFRRVKVGGLGFDDLEKVVHIPSTATEVVITLDDKPEETLKVE